jgi:hypothetical protein
VCTSCRVILLLACNGVDARAEARTALAEDPDHRANVRWRLLLESGMQPYDSRCEVLVGTAPVSLGARRGAMKRLLQSGNGQDAMGKEGATAYTAIALERLAVSRRPADLAAGCTERVRRRRGTIHLREQRAGGQPLPAEPPEPKRTRRKGPVQGTVATCLAETTDWSVSNEDAGLRGNDQRMWVPGHTLSTALLNIILDKDARSRSLLGPWSNAKHVRGSGEASSLACPDALRQTCGPRRVVGRHAVFLPCFMAGPG